MINVIINELLIHILVGDGESVHDLLVGDSKSVHDWILWLVKYYLINNILYSYKMDQAIVNNDIIAVRQLLASGADPNSRIGEGSMLSLAVDIADDPEIIRSLLLRRN